MYLLAMFFHNGVQELKLLVNVILRDHGGFAGVGAGVVMSHSVLRFVFPLLFKTIPFKVDWYIKQFFPARGGQPAAAQGGYECSQTQHHKLI